MERDQSIFILVIILFILITISLDNIGHFEVVGETGSRWLSSALWDCFGGCIFNMVANLFPKQ